jgi:hypothetical protein
MILVRLLVLAFMVDVNSRRGRKSGQQLRSAFVVGCHVGNPAFIAGRNNKASTLSLLFRKDSAISAAVEG